PSPPAIDPRPVPRSPEASMRPRSFSLLPVGTCVLDLLSGCQTATRFETRSEARASAAPASKGKAADINLVELTAEQIQKDYAAGKYTAVQLTQAYLDRIAQ